MFLKNLNVAVFSQTPHTFTFRVYILARFITHECDIFYSMKMYFVDKSTFAVGYLTDTRIAFFVLLCGLGSRKKWPPFSRRNFQMHFLERKNAIKISLNFVPKGPVNNNSVFVKIMVWYRPNNKPLSEPTMVSLQTHIRISRPHWVKLQIVLCQIKFKPVVKRFNLYHHLATHYFTVGATFCS